MNIAIFEFRQFVPIVRAKKTTLEELEAYVITAAKMTKSSFRQKTRIREVLVWRQLFYLVARSFGFSTLMIGRYMLFNHATVIHGSNAAKRLLETDPAMRELLAKRLPTSIWVAIKPKTVLR